MGKTNLQLAEECFRRARITGELADRSIAKYRDSNNKFNSIVGKPFELLTVEDFNDFILKMRDGNASNSRIANVISAVKWVINNLQMNDMIKKTLDLEKVIKPKIEKKPVVYLDGAEIARVRECILKDIIEGGEMIRKVRIMALIEFLLESGARIGEALYINIAEIDWEKRKVPVIGKGNKHRMLRFRENGEYWLKRYLSIRKSDHPKLFVTLTGNSGWAQTDVGRSFRHYREKSGIVKKFTLHTLRHTTASQLALRNVPLPKIQRILGHSNLETTVRYYVGVAEEAEIDKIMNDDYYDFIPKSALESIERSGSP